MIKRRGFIGKLASLLGISALPVQAAIKPRPWSEKTETEDFRAEEERRMAFRSKLIEENLARFEEFQEPMLFQFCPGKLKITKPRQNHDGTWTTFVEHRSERQVDHRNKVG